MSNVSGLVDFLLHCGLQDGVTGSAFRWDSYFTIIDVFFAINHGQHDDATRKSQSPGGLGAWGVELARSPHVCVASLRVHLPQDT